MLNLSSQYDLDRNLRNTGFNLTVLIVPPTDSFFFRAEALENRERQLRIVGLVRLGCSVTMASVFLGRS
jgi:hypothetical protein